MNVIETLPINGRCLQSPYLAATVLYVDRTRSGIIVVQAIKDSAIPPLDSWKVHS